MSKIEKIDFPLDRISTYNIQDFIKHKTHLDLELLVEEKYSTISIKAWGKVPMIRDMFVSFAKKLPEETYAVINFRKELRKIDSEYIFVARGDAILLNNN